MSPVTSGIRKCIELGGDEITADVVLSIGDVELPNWIGEDLITPLVLLKTTFNIISDIFLNDVKNARVAFPHAKIRVIKPTEWLPGYFLGFDSSEKMIQMGFKDASEQIRKNPF
jgi:hypothetical protein